MEDISEIHKSLRRKKKKRTFAWHASVALACSLTVSMLLFGVLVWISQGAYFYSTLGRIQLKLGNRPAAIESFWRACQCNADSSTVSTFVETMKADDMANEAEQRLLALPGSSSNECILKQVVLLDFSLKNNDKALNLCNKWISLSPKSSEAYLIHGKIAEDLKQYQQAVSDFAKSQELFPSSESVDRLANARQKLSMYDNAISDMLKDIKFRGDPNNPRDKLTHAMRHAIHGTPESAIGPYTDLIEHKQLLAASYLGRGAVYRKSGHIKEAIADLTLAIKQIPIESKTGEMECSNYVFRDKEGRPMKSTRLDWAYHERALAFAQLKRYKEALADVNQALALTKDIHFLNTRAEIYDEMGLRDLYLKDKQLAKSAPFKENTDAITNKNEFLELMAPSSAAP